MIIILEGPDGSGKTTLRKTFEERGYFYMQSVPREWPMQYDVHNKLYRDIQDKDVVFDRCFVSELIYRTIKNDYVPNISLKEIAQLLDFHKIIFVYCNTETAFEDSMKRGDEYITDSDEHKNISAMYDIVMNIINKFTRAEVMKYNWHKDNPYAFIRELECKYE